MKRETIIQHYGEETHDRGAVVPPIYQTSLFVYEDMESLVSQLKPETRTDEKAFYSRVGNPTNAIVEKKLAALEGTEAARIFGSGMAAISAAILSCVKAGSHVICVDTVYGPTRSFLEKYLPRFGVETTFVPGLDPQEFADAMRDSTDLVYLESPSSMLFRFQDIEAVTSICRERGVKTIIDNSYATPLFQNPAAMGVDLVCHTASKFLGGHSDIIAGVICGRKELIRKIEEEEVELIGGALAPFPAWLMLRGMRTLPLRVRHACDAGNQIAQYLADHPAVEDVIHAGAEWHPQRSLFLKQMSGSVSLLSFVPKCQDGDKVRAVVRDLELFHVGVSWGGFESLAVANEMQPPGWKEAKWVIRIYAGLEDVGDLMDDLDQALKKTL